MDEVEFFHRALLVLGPYAFRPLSSQPYASNRATKEQQDYISDFYKFAERCGIDISDRRKVDKDVYTRWQECPRLFGRYFYYWGEQQKELRK